MDDTAIMSQLSTIQSLMNHGQNRFEKPVWFHGRIVNVLCNAFTEMDEVLEGQSHDRLTQAMSNAYRYWLDHKLRQKIEHRSQANPICMRCGSNNDVINLKCTDSFCIECIACSYHKNRDHSMKPNVMICDICKRSDCLDYAILKGVSQYTQKKLMFQVCREKLYPTEIIAHQPNFRRHFNLTPQILKASQKRLSIFEADYDEHQKIWKILEKTLNDVKRLAVSKIDQIHGIYKQYFQQSLDQYIKYHVDSLDRQKEIMKLIQKLDKVSEALQSIDYVQKLDSSRGRGNIAREFSKKKGKEAQKPQLILPLLLCQP